MLIVLVRHSSPSQPLWLKLCFLTGLLLFYRAPPYLSTCTLCTRAHSLRPLQVPDSLLDLMYSPPSRRLLSPFPSQPRLFCFSGSNHLFPNNVHCQGCWRGATGLLVCVCSTQHIQIQPAAPVCRLQTLRLDKNLWLFADNRLRSSLSSSRSSLQGLFRSVFVNVLWLHPVGRFFTYPIQNIKAKIQRFCIMRPAMVT